MTSQRSKRRITVAGCLGLLILSLAGEIGLVFLCERARVAPTAAAPAVVEATASNPKAGPGGPFRAGLRVRSPASLGETVTLDLEPIETEPRIDTPPPTALSYAIMRDAGLLPPSGEHAAIAAAVAREIECLALNMYFEARSEPVAGMIAVAHVALNRAADPRFPDTVCEVIKQGGEVRHRCQFSWWCDGRSDEPRNRAAWERADLLARQVYFGYIDDPTGGALWYHADYVDPHWNKAYRRVVKIGRHIFYRDKSDEPVELAAIGSADR